MKMIVLGRLGRDAELRYTPQNEPVMNLALAYNYGKKENGNQPTQWLDATCWGKRAEALAQYMLKGQQLMVTVSDVHIETYEGKDGPGHKLVGRVEDIEFGAPPSDGGGQGQQRSNGGGQQRQAPQQQRQQPERSPGQRSNQQRQAAAPRQPANSGGAGASGFDDMDSDDIPF